MTWFNISLDRKEIDQQVKMPVLAATNFNIILSVLGGWVSLFGLVSYLCKESFYLSEACMWDLPVPPFYFYANI